jgi:hypothetical protein
VDPWAFTKYPYLAVVLWAIHHDGLLLREAPSLCLIGYLGGVWDCSAPVFAAPLHLRIAKHPQLRELRSKKKVELEANFTFFSKAPQGMLQFLEFCTPIWS